MKKKHAKIESLCHSDTYVQFEFCEQLATSSWKQFVANQTKKPQLQDPFIMLSKIFIGDEQSKPIFIGRNIKQEVARK
jgi:hypothetical protein